MEYEYRFFVCPRCGDVIAKRMPADARIMCKVCDVQVLDRDTPYSKMNNMPDADRAIWRKETEEIIRAHPLFDEDAYRARIVREEREEAFRKYNTTPAITCPYCGHDKFQMVARKWSVWTGLLTNKVDRVCERCKRKF
jgi:DNA-directed RNA polymerase subunit RPC12/RpoP